MPRVLKYRPDYKRDGLPPGSVYIGRAMPRYSPLASKWANPFKLCRNAGCEAREGDPEV
jgi:hypothetical protein